MPPVQNHPAPEKINLFWLVDCSGSMTGEKIDALNLAAKIFLSRQKEPAPGDPGPRLFLQVLGFSDEAAWTVPSPVEIQAFVWKDLVPGGATQLGPALELLSDRLEAMAADCDLGPSVVLLLTDGWPSDDYREPLERLLDTPWGERTARVAVAIGPDADCDLLEEFTGAKERVFRNGSLRSLEADLTEAFHAAKEALPSAEPLPGLPERVGE